MRIFVLTSLLVAVAVVQTKPFDRSADQTGNEIVHGARSEQKDPLGSSDDEEQFSDVLDNTQSVLTNEEIQSTDSTVIDNSQVDVAPQSTAANATKVGPLTWLLTPLVQRIQLAPQSFFQDKLAQWRETLNNLGITIQRNVTSKQFGNVNGLLHLLGANDSGFYTNRLDPAGFLGGNGWLANKGGILGGPGAFLSTGSLLTDYPSAYRK